MIARILKSTALGAGLLLLAPGCAQKVVSVQPNFDFSKIKKVAVLGFEDFPEMPGSGRLVSSVFEKAVLRAGVQLVERRQVEAILKEQKLDLTGAVNFLSTSKLGQMLQVDALILGTITAYVPERRDVVLVNIRERRADPIFGTETYTHQRGTGTPVMVQRNVVQGYTKRTQSYQMPQTYTLEAEVGVSVRMVEVQSGEVVWVGSSSEEALNTQIAAERIANRIMKGLKKIWPPVPQS